MDSIAVIRDGDGPEVLLVHGGASPRTTWDALAPLRARWTLALVHRRGYPPSPPPPAGRQDFEVDAADLTSLLGSPVHLVAHSYGVLGTLIAAARTPACARSLTLIEPPLRDAEIPVLVASGGHTDGLERICDALATTLRAERVVCPGAGHFVAAGPGFLAVLERFLLSAA